MSHIQKLKEWMDRVYPGETGARLVKFDTGSQLFYRHMVIDRWMPLNTFVTLTGLISAKRVGYPKQWIYRSSARLPWEDVSFANRPGGGSDILIIPDPWPECVTQEMITNGGNVNLDQWCIVNGLSASTFEPAQDCSLLNHEPEPLESEDNRPMYKVYLDHMRI